MQLRVAMSYDHVGQQKTLQGWDMTAERGGVILRDMMSR